MFTLLIQLIEWFREQNIALATWLPFFPDLKPMDNIWGLHSRMIFANGTLVQTVSDLESMSTPDVQISNRKYLKSHDLNDS